jgi:hypothetical protein
LPCLLPRFLTNHGGPMKGKKEGGRGKTAMAVTVVAVVTMKR